MLKKTNNWIGIIPGSVVEIKLVSNDKLYGNLMSADSLGLILEMDNENVEISKSEISEINVISKKSDRRKAVIAGILMDLCIVVNFIMMSMGGP
ncbi:MAG: hypothetical protein JSW64_15950 [Candidatus Zixiibacteriota bacterium]|nr:MAG: hypothetical protein JSW64_15950 [candidate division Zixibacteria bacterium]